MEKGFCFSILPVGRKVMALRIISKHQLKGVW